MRINPINQNQVAFSAQMRLGTVEKSVLYTPEAAKKEFGSIVHSTYLKHVVTSLSTLKKHAETVGKTTDILYIKADKKKDYIILKYTKQNNVFSFNSVNISVNPQGWCLPDRLKDACSKVESDFNFDASTVY